MRTSKGLQVALRWRQRRQLKSRGARRRERERREKAAEEIRPHIDPSFSCDAVKSGAGGYASFDENLVVNETR